MISNNFKGSFDFLKEFPEFQNYQTLNYFHRSFPIAASPFDFVINHTFSQNDLFEAIRYPKNCHYAQLFFALAHKHMSYIDRLDCLNLFEFYNSNTWFTDTDNLNLILSSLNYSDSFYPLFRKTALNTGVFDDTKKFEKLVSSIEYINILYWYRTDNLRFLNEQNFDFVFANVVHIGTQNSQNKSNGVDRLYDILVAEFPDFDWPENPVRSETFNY